MRGTTTHVTYYFDNNHKFFNYGIPKLFPCMEIVMLDNICSHFFHSNYSVRSRKTIMAPPTTMKGIVMMTTKVLNSWYEHNGISKALPKKAKQNC